MGTQWCEAEAAAAAAIADGWLQVSGLEGGVDAAQAALEAALLEKQGAEGALEQ